MADKTNKPPLPPKLQAALEEISKQPSTLSPELEAYLERTEGWMDRLGEQTAEMLTRSELQSLRREAKETSAYAQKAFAHLRPENKKAGEQK